MHLHKFYVGYRKYKQIKPLENKRFIMITLAGKYIVRLHLNTLIRKMNYVLLKQPVVK